MSEATKRRGKGKKRALVHIALRIPPEVYDFYRMSNPIYTSTMRQVLTEYAERHSVGSPTFPLTMPKEER